jgi:hypothetical protein
MEQNKNKKSDLDPFTERSEEFDIFLKDKLIPYMISECKIYSSDLDFVNEKIIHSKLHRIV